MYRIGLVALLLLVFAGCGGYGESRFKPNAKAMVVRTNGDTVAAHAEGAGDRLTPDTIFLQPGTMVLVESDDAEPFTYKPGGEDAERTFRHVSVLVLDGEHKGVRTKVDFTNLRAIPD